MARERRSFESFQLDFIYIEVEQVWGNNDARGREGRGGGGIHGLPVLLDYKSASVERRDVILK